MKNCTKCKIDKNNDEFYKCSARKDGLQTVCKLCHSKYGLTFNDADSKACSKCKAVKLLDEFHTSKRYKDGRRAQCKECEKKRNADYHVRNKPMRNATSKRYSASENGKMIMRDHHLIKTFGISLHEFNDILKHQNDSCQICKQHKSKFSKNLDVDHNHLAPRGKGNRGILDNFCNKGLGSFNDDPQLLRDAANYLEAHPYDPDQLELF